MMQLQYSKCSNANALLSLVPYIRSCLVQLCLDFNFPLLMNFRHPNEDENCALPIYGPRPGAHNFKKLEAFVGVVTNTFMSLFMATWQYFPFLTCEVKCGAVALDTGRMLTV